MGILFFHPRWGNTYMPQETFLDKGVQANYNGITLTLPDHDKTSKGIKENNCCLILKTRYTNA